MQVKPELRARAKRLAKRKGERLARRAVTQGSMKAASRGRMMCVGFRSLLPILRRKDIVTVRARKFMSRVNP